MTKPVFGTFAHTKFDDAPCSHSSENVAPIAPQMKLLLWLRRWQLGENGINDAVGGFGSLFSHFCQKDVVCLPKMMSLGQKKVKNIMTKLNTGQTTKHAK